MIKHQKPKAILFDWDNTLADTWPIIHKALTHAFETMGETPWTLQETKERVHRSLRDSFPEVFKDRWEEAGKAYIDCFEKIHLDYLSPLEGAKEVLDALRNHDIYVAVVSNKTGYNLRKEIHHLGWENYFSKIIGAKDAHKDKPDPAPVIMALEGSNLKPSQEVWFIGDTVTDLECARNTNCKSVFYGKEDLSHPRFLGIKPDLHVEDHTALQNVIKDWI